MYGNSNCNMCDVRERCGYPHKPCDCAGYRKFRPKEKNTTIDVIKNEFTDNTYIIDRDNDISINAVKTDKNTLKITARQITSQEDEEMVKSTYKVKVYVKHGYFEYEVKTMEQALAHGEAIMSSQTYRRSTASGDVEFLHVYKVKVSGEGLKSEYPDTFKRT